jgi:RNA polymerase sigma-70 factor, ECF subfamily
MPCPRQATGPHPTPAHGTEPAPAPFSHAAAIRHSGVLVGKGDGMSRRATSVRAQPNKDLSAGPLPDSRESAPITAECPAPAADQGAAPAGPSWGDVLLRTFNGLRDELVSTLWFILGNPDDAQDIAQEVFLRCWRTQEGLPEVHNLRAWIFRVGLNAAKDLQRSAWRRRVKPLLGAEAMPAKFDPPVDRALEHREALQQLRDALMHLRPEEKEVFLLRQNGELTYEQIAEAYNRPVGTVKTQMRSALQKLRKVLA